jgi:hypothetical protein
MKFGGGVKLPVTDREQSKEYIVTTETVCKGCDLCSDHGRLDCEIMVRIRRSPVHSQASESAPDKFNCDPAHPFGVPTHPASSQCKDCKARKCCIIWDCPLRNEIARAAREEYAQDLLVWARRMYEISKEIDTMDLRQHIEESLRESAQSKEQPQ